MDLTGELSALVQQHVADGSIPGAVILVARKGQTEALVIEGKGDFESDFVLAADSVFGVMSMTKPLVAAAAMILVHEGVLDLDAPLSRWIPEFAAPRTVRTLKPGQRYSIVLPGMEPGPEPEFDYAPADREITLRHLLSFTSGLQTIGIPNGSRPHEPQDTLESWVADLADIPLEFQPGTQWHYSNATGYDVLGRVIEVASGQPFDRFVHDRIFAPLGMTSARFGVQPEMEDRLVPLGPLRHSPVARADYPSGSAGLFCTVDDYARFAQMLLDEGRWEGRQVMPAQAVRDMKTNQIDGLPFDGIRASNYITPTHHTVSYWRYGFGVGILSEATAEEAVPAGSFGWDGVGTRRFWVMPSLDMVLIMLVPGMGVSAEPFHRAVERLVCTRA